MTDTIQTIAEEMGEAVLLEQLAEEAAELAQAALKVARIVRGENPTPVTYHDALMHLIEEIGDNRLCIMTLESIYGSIDTRDIETAKQKRWLDRIKANRYPAPEPVQSYTEGGGTDAEA